MSWSIFSTSPFSAQDPSWPCASFCCILN
jgi:hypothetical protein